MGCYQLKKPSWRDFAQISQKHVDYLLVDMVSLEPVMGIELDASSHLSIKGRDRDKFVDSVFKAAELPLYHIRASARYDPQEIRQILFGTAQNLSVEENANASLRDKPSGADV